MKFPLKTCMGCGLDLTTAEPAEVKNPGEVALVGTCPECSAPYFMVEDSATPLDAPMVIEPAPVAKKGKSKAKTEPEPPVEPEPATVPPEE